jgi:hypothetical protein
MTAARMRDAGEGRTRSPDRLPRARHCWSTTDRVAMRRLRS